MGQKLKKADKILAANIAADMAGLGSVNGGESAAAGPETPPVCLYTSTQFERIGMERGGDTNSYLKSVQLDKGKIISKKCVLTLNGQAVTAGTDFYPLAGSPDGHTEGSAGVSLNERGLPWIYDLKYDLETGKGNTAGELHKLLENKSAAAKAKGATALLLYNSSKIPDGLIFDANDRSSVYAIPVIYIGRTMSAKVFKDATAYVDINLTVATEEREDYVHNVEGFINNGARSTVVLRASLDTSGCAAALIELARLVKQAGWKKHNYLVLGYSGELDGADAARRNDPVDYRVDVNYVAPDPVDPVLVVTGFSAADKWGSVFGGVKDSYLQVKYVNGGDGARNCTSFAMRTEGPAPVTGADYNREALAVRYIFKLMEAAEKQ